MKNRRHQDLGVKKKRSVVIDIVGNIYYYHCRQGYTMTDMLKPDDTGPSGRRQQVSLDDLCP